MPQKVWLIIYNEIRTLMGLLTGIGGMECLVSPGGVSRGVGPNTPSQYRVKYSKQLTHNLYCKSDLTKTQRLQ